MHDFRTKPDNLDPDDWQNFRSISHDALSLMIDFIATIRERPVWTQAPAAAIEQFHQPLPLMPHDLRAVLADFESYIMPYATGNLHPLFLGWVHGAGTPVGMVAEMLAAGLNANCGGRNHIAIEVERQIVRWAAEMLGFPNDSSGIFVTGTSAANLLAVLIARDFTVGDRVRQDGLRKTGATARRPRPPPRHMSASTGNRDCRHRLPFPACCPGQLYGVRCA